MLIDSIGTPDKSLRSKTAPEKQRRKNWAVGSVLLKTARGEKLAVKAPGQYKIQKFGFEN